MGMSITSVSESESDNFKSFTRMSSAGDGGGVNSVGFGFGLKRLLGAAD